MSVIGISSTWNDTSGTTLDVTRSVTAGNYLLVAAVCTAGTDTDVTFSTVSGSTSAWTEIGTADVFNSGDAYSQEAAWATVTTTGSVTVRATFATARTDRGIVLVELGAISGYDGAAYARDTAAPWASASLTNTNANATRVVLGVWWGGGTGAADTGGGYTDNGSFWPYAGTPLGRIQSRVETSAVARDGAFTAGSGAAPAHVTQFIFNEDVGGPSITALNLYRRPNVLLRM